MCDNSVVSTSTSPLHNAACLVYNAPRLLYITSLICTCAIECLGLHVPLRLMRGRRVLCGHHSRRCFLHLCLWRALSKTASHHIAVGLPARSLRANSSYSINHGLETARCLLAEIAEQRHTTNFVASQTCWSRQHAQVDHRHNDHHQVHVQGDRPTVDLRGGIHCSCIRCSRYVRRKPLSKRPPSSPAQASLQSTLGSMPRMSSSLWRSTTSRSMS